MTFDALSVATRLDNASSGFVIYDWPQSYGLNGFGDGLIVDYDPATRRFALQAGSNAFAFASSDLVSSGSANLIRYLKSNTHYLNLIAPTPGGIRAEYTRFIETGYRNAAGPSTAIDTVSYLLTGIPTRSADFPTTGRVQFSRSSVTGQVVLQKADGSRVICDLGKSTLTLTVDFAGRTLEGNIELIATPRSGGADISLGHVAGATTFDGQATVLASLPAYPSLTNGLLAGAFFGPVAAEAGFVLNLRAKNTASNTAVDIVALGFGHK